MVCENNLNRKPGADINITQNYEDVAYWVKVNIFQLFSPS